MRSPWLVEHHAQQIPIPLGGYTEHSEDIDGNYNPMWLDWKTIVGILHDHLVSDYRDTTANKLWLYSAVASNSFNIHIFNRSDYIKAMSDKITSKDISKILYPSDEVLTEKELRLTQEYFLAACTLRDISRDYAEVSDNITFLPRHVTIQLSGAHPTLAVVELMRILVDECRLSWEQAWEITQNTCTYMNHTLMPEALGTWPVTLLEKLLPCHLQVIFEINHRFLEEIAWRWPDKNHLLPPLSLIDEHHDRQIRMTGLAIVGSHRVNGVAWLHSELVRK